MVELSVLSHRAERGESRAFVVYSRLRDEIFAFRLFPGDRFTESDVAATYGMSRTPVREALTRLQSEGLVRVHFRSGWEVTPMDFGRFNELYEMRHMIESRTMKTLCSANTRRIDHTALSALRTVWCGPYRLIGESYDPRASQAAAALDETFHNTLVQAAGNREILHAFEQLTDKIRIIRRLDFEYFDRVSAIQDEHAAILNAIAARDAEHASSLMSTHIDNAHAAVNQITVERLHQARNQALPREG
jgi:DNA-binding GntR family transcriptional regulator